MLSNDLKYKSCEVRGDSLTAVYPGSNLDLLYCGIQHCESGYRYGPNCRTNYVLHIVEAGRGTLEINGTILQLSAGDLFVICPNITAYYEADRDDPWTYLWVGFDGNEAYDILLSAGLSRQFPVRKISLEMMRKLEERIEVMLTCTDDHIGSRLKRNASLNLFFSDLISEADGKGPTEDEQMNNQRLLVRHCMEYIIEHYAEKLRIAELAEEMGVNRSYLTTCFRKLNGISPQEFLIGLRMEKASSMLLHTELPINEIARKVGYDDPLAFSRGFHKTYGCSPREYRGREESRDGQ